MRAYEAHKFVIVILLQVLLQLWDLVEEHLHSERAVVQFEPLEVSGSKGCSAVRGMPESQQSEGLTSHNPLL